MGCCGDFAVSAVAGRRPTRPGGGRWRTYGFGLPAEGKVCSHQDLYKTGVCMYICACNLPSVHVEVYMHVCTWMSYMCMHVLHVQLCVHVYICACICANYIYIL